MHRQHVNMLENILGYMLGTILGTWNMWHVNIEQTLTLTHLSSTFSVFTLFQCKYGADK